MKKLMFGTILAGVLTTAAFAELPTAADIQKNMGMGFNIGNTMEVPGSPTGWNNAYPTQALLDSIKAAGFNTVRIPCAWDSHAPGGKITETWLDSVKTVVDYAMRAGLYTILNIHHEGEGGWFQTHIGTSVDYNVNTKMKNYWTQIANKFKNYDEHLLFAGANEPGSNIDSWTSAHVSTLMSYYQTFIDAVRGTGANNASRTLIIQGLNTDIDKSVANVPVSVFPKDKITGRLMFEVHYYDNSQYTILTKDDNWGGTAVTPQWYYGAQYVAGKDLKRISGFNPWALAYGGDGKPSEDMYTIGHVNAQFEKVKKSYVENGYPVIVGEFGALKRLASIEGSSLNVSDHEKGRVLWHKDVVTAAKNYGLTPILWDMGNEKQEYDNMAYIRHSSAGAATMGKVVDVDVINAMRSVYGLGNYVNKGVTHREDLIPGNASIGNSSSSVASSSSTQQQASSSGSNPSTCKALTTECYSEAELCNKGIQFYCQGTASSGSFGPTSSESSEINQPTCDALIPECGYTHEALCAMGITEYCMPVVPGSSSSSFDPGMGINELQVTKVTLSRQGNMLVAQGNRASIRLFDMNGNLVREVRALSSKAILSLAGLNKGMYIAKSAGQTLKVDVK